MTISVVVGLSTTYLLIMAAMFQASTTDFFVNETPKVECKARTVTFVVSLLDLLDRSFSLTLLTFINFGLGWTGSACTWRCFLQSELKNN